MAGYLTTENLEHTMELLRRYFRERRGLEVPGECIDDVRKTMIAVSKETREGKIGGDIETMNRRVLSLMIPLVLERLKPREPGGQREPEPATLIPPAPMETLEPMDKDQMFMERLKELEIMRRIPVASIANASNSTNNSVSPKKETVKSTMDLLLPAMNPVNLPTQIATVFMPAPPRRGTELWIQSRQRNWIQSPDRNGFSWAGPIPPGTDLTQTRVLQVFLPEVIHRTLRTPYVVLMLEGAGGQTIQVFLLPGETMGTGWRTYAPASAELGYLKTLATPWTVKLLSASGKMIDMGRDGDAMENCDERSAEEWWMFGTNGSIYIRTGEVWENGAPPVGIECVGLNFSRQWWVLLSA